MISSWTWPVPSSTTISSKFGPRSQPTEGASTNHKGIDIAAPVGTPIVAPCAGKVISSGSATGYGNWIRIDHGDGVISIYGHMYSNGLLVKVGQEVSIGEKIALVGNAGTSTGPHLHFQIEVNGVAKNPENFVSPSGTNIVNSYDHKGYIGDSGLGNYSLPVAGTTAGQRVSGLTTQPIHAYVNIYVGDDLVLLSTDPAKPNILQSFEYSRLDGAGETAYFTLFDDNWEEIEQVLSKNFDRIYIQYGYYGTGMKSKMIKHRLLTYSLSFESTGSIISVASVTEGVIQNLSPKSIALNTYNPTEAVKEICRSLGYTVLDENFDSSSDVSADNPFNMIEEYPISYIQNVIIPQAAQEGEELFGFDVDSEGVAYFKRKSYNTTHTDTMRTYIYQKGYDSPVISLDFQMKGVFGGVGSIDVATGYRSTLFDTTDKSQKSASADKNSVVTSGTGDVTHTHTDQSDPLIDSSGFSENQTKNRLYYYMKDMINDAYVCNMTIVGDPTIEFEESIRLINVTDSGTLHHTSGVYRVNKVTDNIQEGSMITTLELVRNATYNIDGVEIINPKAHIK